MAVSFAEELQIELNIVQSVNISEHSNFRSSGGREVIEEAVECG